MFVQIIHIHACICAIHNVDINITNVIIMRSYFLDLIGCYRCHQTIGRRYAVTCSVMVTATDCPPPVD